jgi:hypothetical protein
VKPFNSNSNIHAPNPNSNTHQKKNVACYKPGADEQGDESKVLINKEDSSQLLPIAKTTEEIAMHGSKQSEIKPTPSEGRLNGLSQILAKPHDRILISQTAAPV